MNFNRRNRFCKIFLSGGILTKPVTFQYLLTVAIMLKTKQTMVLICKMFVEIWDETFKYLNRLYLLTKDFLVNQADIEWCLDK
jgi:hypothetical protein